MLNITMKFDTKKWEPQALIQDVNHSLFTARQGPAMHLADLAKRINGCAAQPSNASRYNPKPCSKHI